MSHRPDCKSRYEAQREGERAFEYGGGNPYRHGDAFESYEDRECREQSRRAFDDGYHRAEEQAREEAEERRAEARRRELREEEDYRAMVEEERERQEYYAHEDEQRIEVQVTVDPDDIPF